MGWTACPAVGSQWSEGNEKEGGLVKFTWVWQQDAASQPNFPDCTGPVLSARIENASAKTYYVRLPSTTRGPIQLQINPGFAKTVTQTTNPVSLADLGLTMRGDCQGVIVSANSDPTLTNVVAR
jgi:hypothetical protein